MRKLKGWDAYVAESGSRNDRCVELPLTDDECYIIQYPTRRQGKAIAEAQQSGDMDALLVALLGKECGERVAELSADAPGYVLDELLLDVLRAFGFAPEDPDAPQELDAGKSSAPPVRRTTTRKRGSSRANSSAA
ncbi:hypothetical protein [Amycolatopsis sp. NPDC021455]|uniref:hypothetical protein n=1 Tax=Amycolatopsis sp. NPDC021455 TaxID=3154901 RepID=UPI0033BFFD4B